MYVKDVKSDVNRLVNHNSILQMSFNNQSCKQHLTIGNELVQIQSVI